MFSQPQFIYSFLFTLLYTASTTYSSIGRVFAVAAGDHKARMRNLLPRRLLVPNLIGGIVLAISGISFNTSSTA
jgi:hypothetical protein